MANVLTILINKQKKQRKMAFLEKYLTPISYLDYPIMNQN